MCTVNQNVIVAADPITPHWLIVVAAGSACVAFVNVTNEPIPKKSYRANTVNVTTSHVNATKGYYVVELNAVLASVANVVVIQDGPEMTAHVGHQTILVCHQVEVKSVRVTVNVFAAHVNARKQARIATQANTVTNAQPVQVAVKNSRTVYSVKFSKLVQWAINQISVQQTVPFKPLQSMLKLSKRTLTKATISVLSTMKTTVNSNLFTTTTMSKILQLALNRNSNVRPRFSFLVS